jgi:hypothetical protein
MQAKGKEEERAGKGTTFSRAAKDRKEVAALAAEGSPLVRNEFLKTSSNRFRHLVHKDRSDANSRLAPVT